MLNTGAFRSGYTKRPVGGVGRKEGVTGPLSPQRTSHFASPNSRFSYRSGRTSSFTRLSDVCPRSSTLCVGWEFLVCRERGHIPRAFHPSWFTLQVFGGVQ